MIASGARLNCISQQNFLEHQELAVALEFVWVLNGLFVLFDQQLHVLLLSCARLLLRLFLLISFEHVVREHVAVEAVFERLPVFGGLSHVHFAVGRLEARAQHLHQRK